MDFVAPDWPRPAELQNQGKLGCSEEPTRRTFPQDRGDPQGTHSANVANIADRHRQEAGKFAMRCGFAADDADVAAKKLVLIREAATDPAKMPLLRTRGIHVAQGKPQRSRPGVAFLFSRPGFSVSFMVRDLADRFPVVCSDAEGS